MSKQETVITRTFSKKNPFTMSGFEVDNISATTYGIVVSGSVKSFKMEFDTSIGSKNYIPAFSENITGTLEFDAETPVIELKKIPIEEAKIFMHEYIKEHPGCRTSDLIIELGLDPELVIQALNQLQREERVEGKDIERD